MAAHIMHARLPTDTFLNINIPNVEADKIHSYKITLQDKRVFADTVVEKVDPRDRKYYWIERVNGYSINLFGRR